jgi:hypothetical protein
MQLSFFGAQYRTLLGPLRRLMSFAPLPAPRSGPLSGHSASDAFTHERCGLLQIAWRRRPGFPVAAGWRCTDLAEDKIDHAIEQVVLVGDVVVERHRFDAELLAELAHAERLDAGTVGQIDGGEQNARSADAGTP